MVRQLEVQTLVIQNPAFFDEDPQLSSVIIHKMNVYCTKPSTLLAGYLTYVT